MWFAQILNTCAEGSAVWFLVALSGILISIVVPYLLGSLNFAIIFSGKLFHGDVRQHGSGNAGGTNMLRTYGKKAALLTILCDMLKAAVGVVIGYFFFPFFGAMGGKMIAGFFVILGHVFPIFFRFRGGKGVAPTAMVILLTSPSTCGILFVIFVILVAITKYVSLGSVMCMLMYPYMFYKIEIWLIEASVSAGVLTKEQSLAPIQSVGIGFIMAILIAALIIFMHRENIVRLLQRKESKLSFKKKNTSDSQNEGEN